MMAAMQRPAGDGRAQDEILAVRLQPSAPQEASTDDRPATDEMLRLQPSLPLLAAAESEPGPSVLGQSSHGREPTAGELWSSLSAAVAAQAEPFELRARAAGREAFGEAFASSPLSEVGRSELGEGTPDRDDRARRTAWSPLSPAEAEMAPPATREGTPSQEARGQELWTSLTAVSNTALSLPLRWLPAAPASPSPEQKPPSPPSPPLPFPLPAQPPPSQQPPQLPSATMLPPVMFKDVFGVGPAMPRDDAVADAGSAAQAPIPAGSPEELLPRQEPLLPPPAWEELQHYALELPSLFAASVSSVASLPEAGRWALPTAVGEMTAPLSLSSTLSAAWLRFNPWQMGPADRFEDWVPRDGWEHWLRHAHAWRDAPDEPRRPGELCRRRLLPSPRGSAGAMGCRSPLVLLVLGSASALPEEVAESLIAPVPDSPQSTPDEWDASATGEAIVLQPAELDAALAVIHPLESFKVLANASQIVEESFMRADFKVPSEQRLDLVGLAGPHSVRLLLSVAMGYSHGSRLADAC